LHLIKDLRRIDMLSGSEQQTSELSLFTIQYPQSPFSKEGAEILTSLLIDEVTPESVSYCFIQQGQSYYMTPYFVNKAGKVGSVTFGLLSNLGGIMEVTIGNKVGHILANPKNMEELARRAQGGTEAFAKLQDQKGLSDSATQTSCSVEQLARKWPEKQLEPAGIRLYRKLAIAELGLAESDVLYFSMQGSPANQRREFNDCLQEVLLRNAGYIFCNDGKHTNLISYRKIAGETYFFICDSQGYQLEKSREEKVGDMRLTVIIVGQELIDLQIKLITDLGYKAVISTETRQYNKSGCPAFAREDLRALYHYEHCHNDILGQSVPTTANPNLLIFPHFPAQMLLLWQASVTTLVSDPRSKHTVIDRDGEQGQLGQLLLMKHYNRKCGYNMYASTLINTFLNNIEKPVRILAAPVSILVARLVPCESTSSALALSLIDHVRADVSVMPYTSISIIQKALGYCNTDEADKETESGKITGNSGHNILSLLQ
jgi:hypothetical protein